MPTQAATGSGILSKLGGLGGIIGKIPRLFTYIFVAFIFISTVSDGWNKMQQTNKPMDFFVSVGVAVVKPLAYADKMIGDTVESFNAGLSTLKTIEAWLTLYGGLSVIYFIYKWTAEYGVKAIVPEGMNSALAIHIITFGFLWGLTTMYYSLSTGVFSSGFHGTYALFTHFGTVFKPIISFGEDMLQFTNKLPDANVPIFSG